MKYYQIWASQDGETHFAKCTMQGFNLSVYASLPQYQRSDFGGEPLKMVVTELPSLWGWCNLCTPLRKSSLLSLSPAPGVASNLLHPLRSKFTSRWHALLFWLINLSRRESECGESVERMASQLRKSEFAQNRNVKYRLHYYVESKYEAET